MKFLHDSNQTIDDDTLVRYSSILSDRFATIEEFLAIDENGLISLGITDPVDRISLIKQVRLFEEKVDMSSSLIHIISFFLYSGTDTINASICK